MSELNLTSEQRAGFEKLRIPPGVLSLADVRAVSDAEARELGFTGFGDLSGVLFPYHLNGAKCVTSRLRRDFPDLDHEGKPVRKYLCPTGDRRHAYIHPDSYALLTDASVPVVLVEAEKSVLAIHSLLLRVDLEKELGIKRLLPLGLGGCYGWSATVGIRETANGERKPEKGLLPELAHIKDGRTSVILFDANSATNPDVQTARRKLATKLRKQGAVVHVTEMFSIPTVNGPDDLIGLPNGDELFLDLLKVRPSPTAEPEPVVIKPKILCTGGNAALEADEAEAVLLKHTPDPLRIFQRAGLIVRVIQLPEPRKSDGFTRPSGSVLLETMNQTMLLETFERLIDFTKKFRTPTGGAGFKIVDCPYRVVDYYKNRTGSLKLPVLVGTSLAPFMRGDGVVVDTAGFDEATGLFLVSDEQWLPVADTPTRDDALESLAILMKPFWQFPWCSPADCSVHLAALLTVIQRRLLPSAPLIGYSAPMPRTGKSALADSVALIGTGRSAPCQIVSSEREEFRKVIFTTLLEGHAIVNLDNIERPLESEALCIALTQPTFKDRILGHSREVELPTRTVWTATGNNLAFRGDLTVRVLICHIDAQKEKPEERTFEIADLARYLRDNRARLVHSILTILRAYYVAGRPVQDLKPWAGFEQWTDCIRAPLVWLGLADPVETRESVTQDAPDRDAGVLLLDALARAFDGESFTMAQATRRAKELGYGYLEDAIRGVAESKGSIDSRRLQYWLREWKGRYANGLSLRDTGKTDNVVRWRIERRETE